jgi:hypothetical protein
VKPKKTELQSQAPSNLTNPADVTIDDIKTLTLLKRVVPIQAVDMLSLTYGTVSYHIDAHIYNRISAGYSHNVSLL